jgi:hypothetical protein
VADICDCSLSEWGQKSDWSFMDVWRRTSSLPCTMAMLAASLEAGRGRVCLGARRRSCTRAGLHHPASNLLGVLFVLVQPRIMKYTSTTAKNLRRVAEPNQLTLRRLGRRSAHLARPGGAARRLAPVAVAPSGCSQVCCCEAGCWSAQARRPALLSFTRKRCVATRPNPQP